MSFAIRELGLHSGVVITASHNPKEYNGYKVYDSKGCQFCTEDAKGAIECINAIENYTSIPFEGKAENINTPEKANKVLALTLGKEA